MSGRAGATHVLAVIGAALLWSTSFAVTKVVLADIGELTVGAVRFLSAAAVLWVVCLLTSQRLRAPLRAHADVALLGLVGITAYFTLENYGVALATATDAALIVASYPVITMLGELVFARTRPSRLMVLGAGLAFLGVFLVVYEQAPARAPHRGWGIVLLLIGGIVWAAYNMLSAWVRASDTPGRLGVLGTTTLQNLWGGLGFVAVAPFLPQGRTSSVDTSTVLLVLYLALGCSALAFLLYTYGLTRLKPAQAVTLLNLVPVFGVVWAVLIVGEHVSLLRAMGAVVVVAGVAISARSGTTRPRTHSKALVTIHDTKGVDA